MASNLIITEKEVNDSVIIVALSGEIDISTIGELKDKLYDIITKNEKSLKLDCMNLNYIDSTGLGVLVGALKKVKHNNKDIVLVNLKSNIKKLFLITGLDKVFVIEE
ncbi:STAS domain-containing protein [Petroclostridium sp. X23]|jgi:anti-sigma B factor antagonist|uniref:STAS domain-containing protein n=1 Tax=Petroclostridium sp. X23 TaxID=3045146 RepID=UPI0024AD4824|nr:STAS domain-containing protein [Petroclostridium sp. X23]WHH56865.1 STAS domain-containing protein [Petroclostridium sp. X23]